jgi:hypothetical protein
MRKDEEERREGAANDNEGATH